MGDLSADDLINAQIQLKAIQNVIQTWTLSPYGAGTQTGRPVSLKWNHQNIYFSELSSTLLQGGKGYGTFALDSSVEEDRLSTPVLGDQLSRPTDEGAIPAGSIVR